MKPKLSIFQLALAGLIAIVSGLICVSFGWIAFTTFTESPGINGDLYYYYRTNRLAFGLYNLFMATGALLTIIQLSFFVYRGNTARVSQTFIRFSIFLAILILSQIYFTARFVGKG